MISQTELKNDLKKLGYKLKPQIGGAFALHDAKGVKVIVGSLDEVHRYYVTQTSGAKPAVSPPPRPAVHAVPRVTPPPVVPVPARAPSPAPAPVVEREMDSDATVQVEVPERVRTAERLAPGSSRRMPGVSPQLREAIDKANHVVSLLKERRLKMGINVSHTDLRINLISKVCQPELLDDVMRHVESMLESDCRNRVLVKRRFRNHLNEEDVMYFDVRYASLLAPE